MRTGKLHVYTGNGKGKTTAAIGLAVRAAGHGRKSYIGQFMKGLPTGEIAVLRRVPEVTIEQFGNGEFALEEGLREPHRQGVQAGLRRLREVLVSGDHAVVVLDEVNVALDFGLLSREELEELLGLVGPEVELICTGRGAPDWLVERADLVSEIRALKHYFDTGLDAREGIEY